MSEIVPSPGSEEAVKKGCSCPVIDNHYGKGIPFPKGIEFIVHYDCPLHGVSIGFQWGRGHARKNALPDSGRLSAGKKDSTLG